MWQYGILPYRLLQMSHQNQYFLLSVNKLFLKYINGKFVSRYIFKSE